MYSMEVYGERAAADPLDHSWYLCSAPRSPEALQTKRTRNYRYALNMVSPPSRRVEIFPLHL